MMSSLRDALDISILVTPGAATYPGECPTVREIHLWPNADLPVTCQHWSLTAHAGTHIDAPRHFDPQGRRIEDLAPAEFEFTAAVLDAQHYGAHVDAAFLEHRKALFDGCDAVLLKTHGGEKWAAPDFDPRHQAIDPSAARWLVDRGGVRLVGIDYFSVEIFGLQPPLTHITLQSAGLFILEGISLAAAPEGRYRLQCLPVLWKDAEAAPCRALLFPCQVPPTPS